MEEWLTYRLSDLLLFSPRTYYRMFELYNRALWPVHLVALGAGAGILILARRRAHRHGTAIMVLLSAIWLWVALAFHVERYATINWAARYFGAAFAAQAALMLWHGVRQNRFSVAAAQNGVGGGALGVVLFAMVAEPLIGPLVGREWTQLEIFGAAPDPTAIATLGVLGMSSGRPPRYLLIIPTLWCAISGATLWAMGSPDALVVPVAAVIAVSVALRGRPKTSE